MPLAGELIIYDSEKDNDPVPEGREERYDYPRFKVGDGVTLVNDLSFVNNNYVLQNELPEIVKDIVEDILPKEEEDFSVSGQIVELQVEPNTSLSVISKIQRDSTWSASNKLTLHHVGNSNFVDLTDYLGGVGTVISKEGLTATINDKLDTVKSNYDDQMFNLKKKTLKSIYAKVGTTLDDDTATSLIESLPIPHPSIDSLLPEIKIEFPTPDVEAMINEAMDNGKERIELPKFPYL